MASALPGFDEHFATPKATPKQSTTSGGATPQTGGATTAPVQSGWSASDFVPSGQTVHDVLDRGFNGVLNGYGDNITAMTSGQDLATLRARREQMNQRMSTPAKLVADTLGQINPTQALRAVPGVGPMLQGAAQEGIRGYAAGEPWQGYTSDAAKGALAGLLGQGLTSPQMMSHLTNKAVTVGAPAALGYMMGGDFEHTLGGALVGKEVLEPLADKLKEWGATGSIPDAAKAAIQNLIIGGGATLTQAGRDTQPPPQPGFGYGGN
jgi:hypothetical protein